MDLTPEMIEQLKADLKKARTYQDLMGENGAIKKIIKASLEGMLDAELTEHLGYEKYSPEGRGSGNNRNDKTHKTLKNDNGEIDITVPRDRNGSFDPLIVKKYERTLGPIKVIDLAKEWHNRPLESIYPIVFFDAIHYKVTSEGKVTNKAAYTCLSLNIDGRKDLLGLWVSEAEGANFWLTVLTELKNRGVQDILIACVDGLKGFPEAINTVFPKTEIQLCIIHLIRNTLKYIASKDQKLFMKELREVYSAPTEEAALITLDKLEETWGKKYSLAIKTWRNNWTHASTFFKYPESL